MNSKNKIIIAVVSAVLVVAIVVGVVLGVTCNAKGNDSTGSSSGGTTQTYNPENRPFVMSLGTPDGVFNPFFSTSAYDGSVVGLTQIGMMGSDKEGKLVWGEDEPVVVKDFKDEYDEVEDVTTFKMIIKNGIKFSDGQPLTIKDVLFNLYLYLDPAYTGSSTIYSTDIQGLAAYRTQNPNATADSMAAFEESFVADADALVDDLVDYVKNFNGNPSDDYGKPNDNAASQSKEYFNGREDEFNGYYERVKELFLEELNTDWNTSAESKESYEDYLDEADKQAGKKIETWHIYLLNDGGVSDLLQKEPTGKFVKDEDGNYKFDFASESGIKYYEEELKIWLEENEKEKTEENIKQWAIEFVYNNYFSETLEGQNSSQFSMVANYWMTADAIRDEFAKQLKKDYFDSLDGGKIVKTISGITTTTTTTAFDGTPLGESHDVLVIKVNGVDPKAQWNFSFTVAPMHYYSTTNYNGKNYIEAFNPEQGEFGIEFSDLNFLNTVVNAPEKVKLPVGAGTYKASNSKGDSNVTGDKFFENNIVYYERNPYFETVGEGIENAKIKYVRYKVVESDQIINSLTSGDIDFGDPNATTDNIGILDAAGVAHTEIYTNGYGYVGINPRFIPDVVVRRAIIKALDRSLIINNYYKGGLADLIERPMTAVSWAYPKGATVYTSENGTSYAFDALGNDIKEMIVDAGYTDSGDGVYAKNIGGFGEAKLEYTFTIAGASKDHPAMAMFEKAAKILNEVGFKIKVVNSQTALSDLSTGKLTVWAAAWGSSVDPDMYQIYHKDSLATSVLNWGYKQIKAGSTTDAYADEYDIVQRLSTLIDAGRETTDQDERAEIYGDALDLVMELAVEFPTYQRKDMSAYNAALIDESTMTPVSERSPYNGLLSRIWELNYN